MFSTAFKYGYVVHLTSVWTWIYHFCNQDACLFPLVARSISMVVLVRWKELGVEKMDSMFMYIFQVHSKSTQTLFLPFSVLSKNSHSTRCIYLGVILGKNIERSHSLPVFFSAHTKFIFVIQLKDVVVVVDGQPTRNRIRLNELWIWKSYDVRINWCWWWENTLNYRFRYQPKGIFPQRYEILKIKLIRMRSLLHSNGMEYSTINNTIVYTKKAVN